MKRKRLKTEIDSLREALAAAEAKAAKAERSRMETHQQAKNRADTEEAARRIVAAIGSDRLHVVEGRLDVNQEYVDVTSDWGAVRSTLPGQRTATMTISVSGEETALLRVLDVLRSQLT